MNESQLSSCPACGAALAPEDYCFDHIKCSRCGAEHVLRNALQKKIETKAIKNYISLRISLSRQIFWFELASFALLPLITASHYHRLGRTSLQIVFGWAGLMLIAVVLFAAACWRFYLRRGNRELGWIKQSNYDLYALRRLAADLNSPECAKMLKRIDRHVVSFKKALRS